MKTTKETTKKKQIKKLLVANRGEIAIRIVRACTELGIRTIGIYSEEDRLSLHRHKADEAYQVGKGKSAVAAYLDIEGIIEIALEHEVDAIHPGYGFLAENADFARACQKAGIIFVGPSPEVIELMGNKQSARDIAIEADIPIIPGSEGLVANAKEAVEVSKKIGFPVMFKAVAGGGGRGMRRVDNEQEAADAFTAASNEAKSAFGNAGLFIEKLIEAPRHIEVQILGDQYGNLVHLYERDCTIQRRHQKIIEIAPALWIDATLRSNLHRWALSLARHVKYSNAGTVEFLLDSKTNEAYFIEVNPRIQVEHTVTEEVTRRDIVKAQIMIAEGRSLDQDPISIASQMDISYRGVAMQCRITTEDPSNKFLPDTGKILSYISAGGFGVRLDGATYGAGHHITPSYDSLLVKMTVFAITFAEVGEKMKRSLREFRIRGVKTNMPFLLNVLDNESFKKGIVTTRFIDEHPELFTYHEIANRGTELLSYIAHVSINGDDYLKEKKGEHVFLTAPIPEYDKTVSPPKGTKQILEEKGASGVVEWIKQQKSLLVTDTTFRDAHQSLLATRVRTHDLMNIAPATARFLPNLFSLEMWGGATFDVAYRFLHESAWDRLTLLRKAVPNMLFQMLLRGSNAVGYTAYPDNVVRFFIRQAADAGIDVFRVFDSLNWVENMKVAIEEALKTGKLVEGAISYSGDISNPKRTKYTLDYYIKMAKELEALGVHIIAIKDMAGLVKPYAAEILFAELKKEVKIPIHFHTHDTSGNGLATYLKAAEAGVDIVDAAISSMSGTTSQPNMQSLASLLQGHERDTLLNKQGMQDLSAYWEVIRQYYFPFEAGLSASAPDVYENEIPGGQYSNLRQQTISLGLAHQWENIKKTYADVNEAFGDIVKVTPSSKAVGDMALALISKDLTAKDLDDENSDISFPDSVVSLFGGYMGQPMGGFPEKLQKRILGGKEPLKGRPGEHLTDVDLEQVRTDLEKKHNIKIDDRELSTALLYPKVFDDYLEFKKKYGDLINLDTPTFFFGLRMGEETVVEIEQGRQFIITLRAIGEMQKGGFRTAYFDFNGRARESVVHDNSVPMDTAVRRKGDNNDPGHVMAPMPGQLVSVSAKVGDKVVKGKPVAVTSAMKMETAITANVDGTVSEVLLAEGDVLDAGDLILIIQHK